VRLDKTIVAHPDMSERPAAAASHTRIVLAENTRLFCISTIF